MVQIFTKRLLQLGLWVVCFGVSWPAFGTAVWQSCTTGNTVSLGYNYTGCITEETSVEGCTRLVAMTIYDSAGSEVATVSSCENENRTAHACEVDSLYKAYEVDVALGSSYSITTYGCCYKGSRKTMTTTINRGQRVTSYIPINTVGAATSSSIEDTCGQSQYDYTTRCSCNTGFASSNPSSPICGCDKMASGYSCYVAGCTHMSYYIASDRKSCDMCPIGSATNIEDANKIYSSTGLGVTGQVAAAQFAGTTMFQAADVSACYVPYRASTYQSINYMDKGGNVFQFSNTCHYTE